jgi:Ca-activated chloride channel family protein
MKRMMTSSGMPTRPSMAKPFGCLERSPDSITSGVRQLRLNGPAIIALILTLAGWHAAAAQFTSGVNLVEVYAAVVDGEGRPVTGLTRDDFTVLEDGVSQSISTFTEGDFPLSVAVAIDRSFSMTDRIPLERDAARTFLRTLRSTDEAMIVAIGSEVELASPLSTNRDEQVTAVDRVQPWGTTGLHDAIIKSIDAIQGAKGRRALLLMSDGSDRYSTASAQQALDRARQSDVMIYPVALGRTRPALFAQLATLTGGRSFQPKDARQLTDTVQAVADELRHQYLLGYTPSRPIVAGDPQWRSIVVNVKRSGATVRARDGYLTR